MNTLKSLIVKQISLLIAVLILSGEVQYFVKIVNNQVTTNSTDLKVEIVDNLVIVKAP
jgi:hypothetical protein